MNVKQVLNEAVVHHRAGRLAEAERLYRQVLAHQPKHPDALNLLGTIAARAGQWEAAADLIRRAIAIYPIAATYHNHLGNVLRDSGQFDEAVAAYRQAVKLKPDFADAYCNVGDVLREKGQCDEAIAAYRQAIAMNPEFPIAYSNLGYALLDQGQLDDAIAACRRAVALEPKLAAAYYNLGIALRNKGQLEQASAAFRQAVAAEPKMAEAYNNLGNVLCEMDRPAEAAAAFQQAIAVRPNFPQAFNNLGNALKDGGQFDQAAAALRQAIALQADYPIAYNNLGNYLKETGQLDQAIVAYQKAIALKPDYISAYSNLIYSLHFLPQYDPQRILAEQKRWANQLAQPLQHFVRSHANDRNRDRRLRIGYVSPDFRDHVVGRNILPLLREHDPKQIEIFCYSNSLRNDLFTDQLRSHAKQWRVIINTPNDAAAEMIRSDGIDILVDLALHMADNRLLVFAYKPAPVQCTFAGYPGGTGLETIDYRLSDPFLDPPEADNERFYVEKTLRLPDSFWCYDHAAMELDKSGPVNELPALSNGYITFGCLNNFCKINEGQLKLWAQVMTAVANSKLVVLSEPGTHRQTMIDRLAEMGVESSRVEFIGHRPRDIYLREYHRIDLGLDSFPYNGHTTSLDSLWMGVPVVTLVGETAVSRAGWCQLSNLGLQDLAGQSPEQFVRMAVELAGDLPRLKELRGTLRGRMERSPLMDAPKFARNIEALYRQVWKQWCEG